MPPTCEQCGGPLTRPTQTRFCSRKCAVAFRNPPVYVICKYCGAGRRMQPKDVPKHTTCGSPECKKRQYAERQAARWASGLYGAETIAKMAASLRENRPPDVGDRIKATRIARGTWNNAHLPDMGERVKKGLAALPPEKTEAWHANNRGARHYLWKGGVWQPGEQRERKTPGYRIWRRTVFERDGFKCRTCGAKGYVVAHHIKGFREYPELRFEPTNGLTLCRSCHAKVHSGTVSLNDALVSAL